MKKKVILIQDSEDILNLIDGILTDDGFEVLASLTTDPIKDIDAIEPDLLIVDDHLKGTKKGSEIIAELKSDPHTEDLSAVLTSTASNLEQISHDCKADDFIEKPFDIDHLREIAQKNTK